LFSVPWGGLFKQWVFLFQSWKRATGQEWMGELEIQRTKFVSAAAGKFRRQATFGESCLLGLIASCANRPALLPCLTIPRDDAESTNRQIGIFADLKKLLL